jgi:hypothetical protein
MSCITHAERRRVFSLARFTEAWQAAWNAQFVEEEEKATTKYTSS